MKGAIAAGHPLTAETGARVLEAGGNAVDACVAASFASWVCESPLTGPGGGGFMLVHHASDRKTRVIDCYVAVPSGRGGEMEAIDVDFSGGSTQVFRIGGASVAVPGALAGLEEAHRRFGSLPWRELFEPGLAHALPRRPRTRGHPLPEGAGRRGDAARPARVPGDPPPPGGGALPRQRLPVEPAARGRRRPRLLRAPAARAGKADGRADDRGDPGPARGPREAAEARPRDRRDDAHL